VHSRRMNRDPYAAHAPSGIPRGKVNESGGAGSNRYT
jgi:hypothetical protein